MFSTTTIAFPGSDFSQALRSLQLPIWCLRDGMRTAVVLWRVVLCLRELTGHRTGQAPRSPRKCPLQPGELFPESLSPSRKCLGVVERMVCYWVWIGLSLQVNASLILIFIIIVCSEATTALQFLRCSLLTMFATAEVPRPVTG